MVCHLMFLSFVCPVTEIQKYHLSEVKFLIFLDLVLEYAYSKATAVNLPFEEHIEQNCSLQNKGQRNNKTPPSCSFIILFILLSHVLDRLLMFFTK